MSKENKKKIIKSTTTITITIPVYYQNQQANINQP